MPKRRFPFLLFSPLLLALFATAGSAENTSTTTITPDNDSPVIAYVVAALSILAGPTAGVVIARMNNKTSAAELHLEHAAQMQKDIQASMRDWMEQQLEEKDDEIKALRQRCDDLEQKVDELEDELQMVKLEKRHVENRYNTLVLEYGRLKSPTSADIDD